MLKRDLELIDYLHIAGRLSPRVEPETVMAVVHVEGGEKPFYADGFPMILFERHKFYKNARRSKRDEWSREFPEICHHEPTQPGHYGSKQKQREKFSQAFDLDGQAAMMACSWGAFQELGENYDDCGFKTVDEFVDMMNSGIDGQVEIFVRSIKHRGLVDELEVKDFTSEARQYNGPGFRRFHYDDQMRAAYRAAKLKKIDWAKVEREAVGNDPEAAKRDPAGSNISQLSALNAAKEEPETGAAGDAPQPEPIGDAPDVRPSHWFNVEDWKPLVMRWLARIWAMIVPANVTQALANLVGAVNDPDHWHVYAIAAGVIFVLLVGAGLIVSTILLVIWLHNRGEIKYLKGVQLATLADPTKKNVGLIFERK